MALDPKGAALALHRFGLGPRAGSIAAIASDPRGALLAELDRPGAGQISDPELLTSGAANRRLFEANAKRLAEQKLAQKGRAENPGMEPPAMDPLPGQKAEGQKKAVPLPQRLFLREARARYDAAIGADIGFVERLVWFWSNHFCVSIGSTIDPATRRLAVRAEVENPDNMLKPEMFAQFSIAVDAGVDSPAVPVSAVVYEDDQARVWVEAADARFASRTINVGLQDRRMVQVLGGLEPGDRVVTRGSLFIDRAARPD